RLRSFLRVEGKHGKRLAWKPTTLADAARLWEQNPTIRFALADAGAMFGPHYVILAPETAWPSGTELHVVLGKGAPSSEGPIVRDRDTSARFDVAARFTVRGITCGDAEKPRMAGATCPANNYVSVEFSNTVAEKSYRSSMVQIVAAENGKVPGEPSDQ